MTDTPAYHGTELIVADDKQENDLESRIITQEKKLSWFHRDHLLQNFIRTSYDQGPMLQNLV
jgi:hypothetical protein